MKWLRRIFKPRKTLMFSFFCANPPKLGMGSVPFIGKLNSADDFITLSRWIEERQGYPENSVTIICWQVLR